MTLRDLICFLSGVGMTSCLALVYLARVRAQHELADAALHARAQWLTKSLARFRAERLAAERADMLTAALEPMPPRRFVIPPAPVLAASAPPPLPDPEEGPYAPAVIDVAYLDQLDREALRCAAVRAEWDRDRCFDPLCDRCNPGPVDRHTAALDLAEVSA